MFCVSSYRRKRVESYSSHDLFRKENSEAAEIRQLSVQEAQDDATKWLQDGGDVAVSLNSKYLYNYVHNRLFYSTGIILLSLCCVY